jgi:ABC-type multidrug transport system fused ATPase/permease subunit
MSKIALVKEFLQHERWRAFGVLLLDFCANLGTLLIPVVLAQAYGSLFGLNSQRGRILGFNDDITFNQWAWILLGLIVFKAILDFWRVKSRGFLVEHFLFYLRQRIFQHHLGMELAAYESKGVGRYLLRFSGDLSSAQNFLAKGILQFYADLMLLGIGLFFMFWADWLFGGTILLALVFITSVLYVVNRKIGKIEAQRRDFKAGLLGFIQIRLLNMAPLKAFNRQRPEREKFERKTRRIQQMGFRYQRLFALSEAGIPFGLYAMMLLVLVLMSRSSTGPQALSLILILLSWRSALSRLMRVGLIWKKGEISLRKIEVLFTEKLEVSKLEIQQNFSPQSIRAIQVGMEWSGQQIFQGLNFELNRGAVGLVIGPSGSGKTVLLKLLAKLYSPTQGEFRFNDQIYSDLGVKNIRKAIGFVSAALPLYGNTIAEALIYNNKRKDKADKKFQKWQVLFPELQNLQFEQILRESSALSTQQKCLLECLRAILTNKPFLVFDETITQLPVGTIKMLWNEIPKQTGVLLICSEANVFQSVDIHVDWMVKL